MYGVCLCMGIIFARFSLPGAKSLKLSFVSFTRELCLHGFFLSLAFLFLLPCPCMVSFLLGFSFLPPCPCTEHFAWTHEYHGELGHGLGMKRSS